MQTITDNKELFTSLFTIVIGAIFRAIEKRKLRKEGKLID
jgi:hypothetical protein